MSRSNKKHDPWQLLCCLFVQLVYGQLECARDPTGANVTGRRAAATMQGGVCVCVVVYLHTLGVLRWVTHCAVCECVDGGTCAQQHSKVSKLLAKQSALPLSQACATPLIKVPQKPCSCAGKLPAAHAGCVDMRRLNVFVAERVQRMSHAVSPTCRCPVVNCIEVLPLALTQPRGMCRGAWQYTQQHTYYWSTDSKH